MASEVPKTPANDQLPPEQRLPEELEKSPPIRRTWRWLHKKDAASDFRALIAFVILFLIVAVVISLGTYIASLFNISVALPILVGALLLGLFILALLSARQTLIEHADSSKEGEAG